MYGIRKRKREMIETILLFYELQSNLCQLKCLSFYNIITDFEEKINFF